MLKQEIEKNLQSIVQYTLLNHGSDETLAYDISRQCVDQEDVDKCLEIMLEHIPERELEVMVRLTQSAMYERYTQALTESVRVIEGKVKQTLKLLTETEGRG